MTNPHPPLPQATHYRDTKQISDLQIRLGMRVESILRDIETAQKKIDAVKHEIANRWRQVRDISPVDRRRLTERETASRVREVMDDVVVKLDKDYAAIRELYQEIENAKVFYPGKLQFLMNATIMSESRSRYAAALSLAGPMELAGYASYAIGVQDSVMAAAVIQANDALPSKERRFHSGTVAERISIPAWESLQSALSLSFVLVRQAEIIVRTFKSGKPCPIDTIRLAMLNGDLDKGQKLPDDA